VTSPDEISFLEEIGGEAGGTPSPSRTWHGDGGGGAVDPGRTSSNLRICRRRWGRPT
jgi:hypothetical protein